MWPHDFVKTRIEHMFFPRKTRMDDERKKPGGGGGGWRYGREKEVCKQWFCYLG